MSETYIPVRDLQQAIVAFGLPLPRYGIDGACGNETLAAARNLFVRWANLAVTPTCGAGSLSWAVILTGSATDVRDAMTVIGNLAREYNPAMHGTGRVVPTTGPGYLPRRTPPRPPEAGGTEPVVPPIDDSAPTSPTVASSSTSWVPLAVVGVGVVGLVAYMMWGK